MFKYGRFKEVDHDLLYLCVKVKEDVEFVELIKSFFIDHSNSNPKPAISEHSTYEVHEEAEEEDEVEEEMTMSEEMRLGSPDDDDVSNQNLRSDLHIESTHTLGIYICNIKLLISCFTFLCYI